MAPGTLLLVVGGSALMVVLTIWLCNLFVRVESYLPRWAERHGYRILRREQRLYRRGPFLFNSWCGPVYYISVKDASGRKRGGWVYFGLLSREAQVRWAN